MIIYLEDRLPQFRWECSSIPSLTEEPSRNVSWISSVYHLPLICWWWPKANCGCVHPTSQNKRIRKTQQSRTNCLHKQFEFNLQKTVFHFPFPSTPTPPTPHPVLSCSLHGINYGASWGGGGFRKWTVPQNILRAICISPHRSSVFVISSWPTYEMGTGRQGAHPKI